MNCFEWLKFGASLLVSVIAVTVSIISLRQIRIHSSPKPFLKVEDVSTLANFLCPEVEVRNMGHGLAVNTHVQINVRNINTNRSEQVILDGQQVLLPNEVALFKPSPEDSNMLLEDTSVITISYESDSGFERTVIWEVSYEKGVGYKQKLISST